MKYRSSTQKKINYRKKCGLLVNTGQGGAHAMVASKDEKATKDMAVLQHKGAKTHTYIKCV